MAILKIKDKGVWKEIQAIKGDTGHDVYVGDKSKAPSEAKLIIEPVKGTATGTDIQVTDSANDRVSKLVLDGKSTQETRSGKNLFDVSKLDVDMSYKCTTNISDEKITITSNSSTGVSFCTLKPDLKLKPNTTYSIGFDFEGSINQMRLYDVTANEYINISQSGTSRRIGKVTTNDNTDYRLVIYVALNQSMTVSKIQVEEGIATEYEPYGVMPSPDYPSEIENVKGKNLWGEEEHGTINESTGVDIYNSNRWRTKGYIKVNSNTSYTLSSDASNNIYYIFYYYNKDKTFIKSEALVGTTSATSTSPSNCEYLRCVIADTASIKTTQRQLEKGSVATRYVPYGNIQIVETGKNIAKFDQSKNTNINSWIYTSNVANNITATKKGTGDSFYATFVANVVKGEQYVFSTSTSNRISMYCYSDKLWGTGIKGLSAVGLSSAVPLKFTSNYTGQMIIGLYGVTTSVEAKDFQLEKGSVATDYEPYTEQVVNIDLKGNELCSLPNETKDELIVKDGRAKIIKKVGKVVLDGTGNNYQAYTNYSGEGYCYYYENTDFALVPINTKDYQHSMCSHFKNVYAVWGYTTSKIGTYSDHGSVHRKYFISDKPTVAEFKACLQDNPVTLQYVSETPEEIDLGEVSTLTTYEGTSNITNSEDTNMSIEYDTNKTNLYYQNNGNIIKMNEGS